MNFNFRSDPIAAPSFRADRCRFIFIKYLDLFLFSSFLPLFRPLSGRFVCDLRRVHREIISRDHLPKPSSEFLRNLLNSSEIATFQTRLSKSSLNSFSPPNSSRLWTHLRTALETDLQALPGSLLLEAKNCSKCKRVVEFANEDREWRSRMKIANEEPLAIAR